MNKTILITGASSGIGNITARHFQARGWNVIATMRDPARGAALAGLDNVFVTRLDVRDGESIHAAIAAGIAHFGSIDVLLNNAGYGASGPLEATPAEKIRRQFDTNVIGLLETTKAVLPLFRGAGKGIVINISSPAGKAGFPLSSLYCGSKFAVEGLSEALSFELGAIGITVKIVTPGHMATEFGGASFDFNNEASLAEYQPFVRKFEAIRQNYPAGGDPATVAEVIYQAATDGSRQLRYIAGNDARALIAARHASDDATFMQGIASQFGL
ncbi:MULTISPECIES: SDR family oxidoreductase [unclassified Janthinobacterium]|uniref:SDR family oxidoreductase n=1 Tax=unclassified Janthinobacterium TaxID=2610881 RepID=UPI001621A87D|nr:MULTISPECIES: SDR family oxidoreductase [unclassified Janthinobacterium]MBB5368360.1 NAD(P)-dependent dehydrogenase (short-subunit alcohol dehydrogenase family) [Janthinobacterium sp. K2C7]MBB5382104.1 NAD(P)-dependent dehydrogenase (short-subunit alcohol dehydrogenase family) [Janthinobacterium sp. K2Li3]MBB5386742.1 NAD(P)-dependent dehydrogenase (short-subunit alcohol dehydrogenase family) [Janthinobacterium sp. K2E3]